MITKSQGQWEEEFRGIKNRPIACAFKILSFVDDRNLTQEERVQSLAAALESFRFNNTRKS